MATETGRITTAYVLFMETEDPVEDFPAVVTIRPNGAMPLIAMLRVFLKEGIARGFGPDEAPAKD